MWEMISLCVIVLGQRHSAVVCNIGFVDFVVAWTRDRPLVFLVQWLRIDVATTGVLQF